MAENLESHPSHFQRTGARAPWGRRGRAAPFGRLHRSFHRPLPQGSDGWSRRGPDPGDRRATCVSRRSRGPAQGGARRDRRARAAHAGARPRDRRLRDEIRARGPLPSVQAPTPHARDHRSRTGTRAAGGARVGTARFEPDELGGRFRRSGEGRSRRRGGPFRGSRHLRRKSLRGRGNPQAPSRRLSPGRHRPGEQKEGPPG